MHLGGDICAPCSLNKEIVHEDAITIDAIVKNQIYHFDGQEKKIQRERRTSSALASSMGGGSNFCCSSPGTPYRRLWRHRCAFESQRSFFGPKHFGPRQGHLARPLSPSAMTAMHATVIVKNSTRKETIHHKLFQVIWSDFLLCFRRATNYKEACKLFRCEWTLAFFWYHSLPIPT